MKSVLIRHRLGLWRTRRAIQPIKHKFNAGTWSLLLLCSCAAGADSGFTLIDYPGASSTQAWGINSRGDIPGYYTGADNNTHGFLMNGGHYTAIDYPGAAGTGANGINNSGQIVGLYYNTPYIDQGFIYSSGVFSTIDYPGADISGVTGINDSSQVVGVWGGPSAVDDYDIRGFVATPIPGTHDAQRQNGSKGKGFMVHK